LNFSSARLCFTLKTTFIFIIQRRRERDDIKHKRAQVFQAFSLLFDISKLDAIAKHTVHRFNFPAASYKNTVFLKSNL